MTKRARMGWTAVWAFVAILFAATALAALLTPL
jgi:hypothetical protein